MSHLTDLYKKQSKTLSAEVASFIESPENISSELDNLKALIENPSYEKVEVLFLMEVLSQTLKKQQDFTRFISIVLEHLEGILSYKNSIFILRILKNIMNTRFYVPTVYYISKVLQGAAEVERPQSTGRIFTYDDIRLSSDDLKSSELQNFIAGECI
ncbi:hypothetical protein PAEPH01_2317, partial [Pancytospora epiphaga]